MLKNYQVVANLPAEDIERAKKFYTEKVGLDCTFSNENQLVFTASGNSKLFIYKTARTTAQHTAAAFQGIKNLEEVVEGLRKNGIVFEEYDFPGLKTVNGIATLGDEKAAWFKDSEGNIICVGTEIY